MIYAHILLGEILVNGIPLWLFLILILVSGGLILIFRKDRNSGGRL